MINYSEIFQASLSAFMWSYMGAFEDITSENNGGKLFLE